MKRLLDVVLACLAIVALSFPTALIAVLVRLTSRGPVVHWSDRIGRNNTVFRMPKFRTMHVGTPIVTASLLHDTHKHLTPLGGFLRRYSLDELPQLWSILRGEMSLVGPRPALTNEKDLIAMRNSRGIQALVPGLTGWAQVNGRNEIPLARKVDLDSEYLRRHNVGFDLLIICRTAIVVATASTDSH